MFENNLSIEESRQMRSAIACHVCRKRKIKCGKELPHCSICKSTFQQCEYPGKALKPGPKIGSTQTSRKRKIRDDSESDRRRSLSTTHEGHARSHDALPAAEPMKDRAKNMQSLSFIIHPTHDTCSPEGRKDNSPASHKQGHQEHHLASSCYSLGFTPEQLNTLIDRFFENFTSFQLFREPDFRSKLQRIDTSNQCKALLAAILVFATKSYDQCDDENAYPQLQQTASISHLVNQTLKYVDLAINDCEDAPIPLPLLQALILITHWLLIRGVLGRAWRYLGVAIRIAYELNMHLIDANSGYDVDAQPEEWCEDEERRRAWWAIWEMDVFASVIRRCPTAIDWSQNETFLPTEEERWLRGEPQRSCSLRLDPVERYKVFEATGNASPKAWFIVINSLMKDAQKITSPMGVDRAPATIGQYGATRDQAQQKDFNRKLLCGKESLNRLRIIQNALQCTVMALPNSLKYRNQYLCFGTRELDRKAILSLRLQHSSIYSIHAMAQLTKLMIHKHSIFRDGTGSLSEKKYHYPPSKDSSHLAVNHALEQYCEASDEIAFLAGRSYEEHYRYVNPFLANTIWLAGAVQLLYRELGPLDISDKPVVSSKLELLNMTYKKFVSYWGIPSTLQKSLEVVETEIENLLPAEQEESAKRPCMPDVEMPHPIERQYSKADGHIGQTIRENPSRGDTRNNNLPIVSSENLNRLPNSTLEVQDSPWAATENNNNYSHGGTVNFDAMEPRLFGDSCFLQHSQMQEVSHARSSTNVGAFFDSASTMDQIPAVSRNLPSGGVGQEVGPLSLYSSAGAGSFTDFPGGMSCSRNNVGTSTNLSNYFGEMLSGSYMT